MKKGIIVAIAALALVVAVYMFMFNGGIKVAANLLKSELDSDPRYSYSEYKFENNKIIITDLTFIDNEYKIFIAEAKIDKITKTLKANISSNDVEIYKIYEDYDTYESVESIVMRNTDLKKLIKYDPYKSKPSESGISDIKLVTLIDGEHELPVNILINGKKLTININDVKNEQFQIELAELIIKDIDLAYDVVTEINNLNDDLLDEKPYDITEKYTDALKKFPLESLKIKKYIDNEDEYDDSFYIDDLEIKTLDLNKTIMSVALNNFKVNTPESGFIVNHFKFDELNYGDYIDYYAKVQLQLEASKYQNSFKEYINTIIESCFIYPASYKGFEMDGIKIITKDYDNQNTILTFDIELNLLKDSTRGEFIENGNQGATVNMTLSDIAFNELVENSESSKDSKMLLGMLGGKNTPLKINIDYSRAHNESKTIYNDKFDISIDELFTYNIQADLKGINKEEIMKGGYDFTELMQISHLSFNYEDTGMFEKIKEYIPESNSFYLQLLLSMVLDDKSVNELIKAQDEFYANQQSLNVVINSENVSIGKQFNSLENFVSSSEMTVQVNGGKEIDVVFDTEKLEQMKNKPAYDDDYYYDDEYDDDEYYDDYYYGDEEYYEDEEYYDDEDEDEDRG